MSQRRIGSCTGDRQAVGAGKLVPESLEELQ